MVFHPLMGVLNQETPILPLISSSATPARPQHRQLRVFPSLLESWLGCLCGTLRGNVVV